MWLQNILVYDKQYVYQSYDFGDSRMAGNILT